MALGVESREDSPHLFVKTDIYILLKKKKRTQNIVLNGGNIIFYYQRGTTPEHGLVCINVLMLRTEY